MCRPVYWPAWLDTLLIEDGLAAQAKEARVELWQQSDPVLESNPYFHASGEVMGTSRFRTSQAAYIG